MSEFGDAARTAGATSGFSNRPEDYSKTDRMTFKIEDSGKHQEFEGGMVRDSAEGKTCYDLVLDGPMFGRWAEHLTRAVTSGKYEERNWMKAKGDAEYQRFRRSAFRHFVDWWAGKTNEDHAAAVLFNINGAEYLKEKLDK